MNQEAGKKAAALAAIDYIDNNMVVGIGTGSTVDYFIEALAKAPVNVKLCIPSSNRSKALLEKNNLPTAELNMVSAIDIYIDGADEATEHLQLIKGGGGALTGEKILAANSHKFICIIDKTKIVGILGKCPLPVEVLPMARSSVARELVRMGGNPAYREGFLTDNGNIILDVYNLDILEPIAMEEHINHIPGVVTNGLFAKRRADLLLVGSENGVEKITL
jgi:ribose 5-phosphate isomerase A